MNTVAEQKPSHRIRVLNDNFRSTFIGGRIVTTPGVAELPLIDKAHVLLNVQRFADFNADNDPHGEHDFGSFEFGGVTYFFKIDYYSPNWTAARKTPPILRRRRAFSPSCAPTSTNPQNPNRKEASDGPATNLSRIHSGQTWRGPGGFLASHRCCF